MTALALKVDRREQTGKKVEQLRTGGKIPGVLYGHGVEPTNVSLDLAAFQRVYKAAGESTLIDLTIEGSEPVKALIQDVQRDPIKDRFIHVDLHQIRMDEELDVDVELKFVGEAPAVKELSAILVTPLSSIEVKCLPKDLVHQIEVDLGNLKQFDDAIHIADITIPAGLTVLNAPDEVVALVQEPRREEELEKLDEKVEAKLPEGVADEKAAEIESEGKADTQAEEKGE